MGKNLKRLATVFSHSFFYTATVKWLKSSRFFQTFESNSNYWNAFAQSKQKSCLWQFRYPNYKAYSSSSQKNAPLEPCFVPNVPFSSPYTRTFSIIILLWRTALKNRMMHLNAKHCYEDFPGFFILRQHKNSQRGCPIRFVSVFPDDIINDDDDEGVKEELQSCQKSLVDSELEKAQHKVFNYAIDDSNTKIVDFFRYLKCAVEVNLAFGFVLKNIEERI